MSNIRTIHARNEEDAATTRAIDLRLPLGSVMTVSNQLGEDRTFMVTRSVLSESFPDGGRTQVTEIGSHQPSQDVHTIYAKTAKDAALLYAAEMGNYLPSDTILVSPLGQDVEQPDRKFKVPTTLLSKEENFVENIFDDKIY